MLTSKENTNWVSFSLVDFGCRVTADPRVDMGSVIQAVTYQSYQSFADISPPLQKKLLPSLSSLVEVLRKRLAAVLKRL